jgi:hypothetical protein
MRATGSDNTYFGRNVRLPTRKATRSGAFICEQKEGDERFLHFAFPEQGIKKKQGINKKRKRKSNKKIGNPSSFKMFD